MDELVFNARTTHRYDHFENWAINDPILFAGEIAFAYVPSKSLDNNIDNPGVDSTSVHGTTPPRILMKVGDGVHKYSELEYVYTFSADVYSWATAATKPEYTATEIKDLDQFINARDIDTQYTIVKDDSNDYRYKLQSKARTETEFVDTGIVIDIPRYNDSELAQRVTDAETAIQAIVDDYLTSVDKEELRTANQAIRDGNGNIIANTYIPKPVTAYTIRAYVGDYENTPMFLDIPFDVADNLSNIIIVTSRLNDGGRIYGRINWSSARDLNENELTTTSMVKSLIRDDVTNGSIDALCASHTLKIGNTTLNEQQLQKIIALINTIR